MEETGKAIVALHRAARLRGHIGRFAWPAPPETLVRSRLGSCNEWPMTRYFPGLVESLKAIQPKPYVVGKRGATSLSRRG